MCRSIKTLRSPGQPASEAEIQAAALQYVRKISGYRLPSRRNREAFEEAVAEVAAATGRLLEKLRVSSDLSR
jgi:hypothetical protein